jgi:hypothetical protein
VIDHNDANRRAILRISHDVDDAGHVINVRLEPLAAAALDDVIWATWQAAHRCHPWIIGEEANQKFEASREIALSQIGHLMTSADEVLLLMAGFEHVAFHRLRDAIIDLRGYLPTLHGRLPRNDQRTQIRRAS